MKILLNKQQHAALSHIAAWAIVVDRLLDKLVDARSIGAKDALRLLDVNTGSGTIRKILRFTELVDANMIAEYVAHSQGRARIEVDMPESLMRKFQDRDRQRKHSAS